MSDGETEPLHCSACGSRRLAEVVSFVAFQTRAVLGRYDDGEVARDCATEMSDLMSLGKAVEDAGELEARCYSCGDCDWRGTELPATDRPNVGGGMPASGARSSSPMVEPSSRPLS